MSNKKNNKQALVARCGAHFPVGLLILTGLMLSAEISAQTLVTRQANSSNNTINDIVFVPPQAIPINTDQAALTSLRALVHRVEVTATDATIDLIAFDTLGNKIVSYPRAPIASSTFEIVYDQCAGPGPVRPNGASIDDDRNLYATSSGASLPSEVWVLKRDTASSIPGCLEGYELPRRLALFAGSPDLEETVVVPGDVAMDVPGWSAGDLLVLMRNSAQLVRFAAADIAACVASAPSSLCDVSPAQTVIATSGFPSSAEPTGVDFVNLDLSHRLAIVLNGGDVLVYFPNGTRQSVDFVNGLGNGPFKDRVGTEGGQDKLVLTNRNGGEILKIAIVTDLSGNLVAETDGMGNPVIATVTAGVEFPIGIDLLTSDAVDVTLCTEINSAIENCVLSGVLLNFINAQATAAGSLGLELFFAEDPRCDANGNFTPGPLTTSQLGLNFDVDVRIPNNVTGFPVQIGGTTVCRLVFGEANGVALVNGFVEIQPDEGAILGFDPSCTDLNFQMRPRTFYHPNLTGLQIPEGDELFGVTWECNRDRSGVPGWSLFMPAARWDFGCAANDDACRIAAFENTVIPTDIARLEATLENGVLPKRLGRNLRKDLAAGGRDFGRGRYAKAVAKFDSFGITVCENFDQIPEILEGNLLIKALHISFEITEHFLGAGYEPPAECGIVLTQ